MDDVFAARLLRFVDAATLGALLGTRKATAAEGRRRRKELQEALVREETLIKVIPLEYFFVIMYFILKNGGVKET